MMTKQKHFFADVRAYLGNTMFERVFIMQVVLLSANLSRVHCVRYEIRYRK